jgi:predicted dehydrogenase
VINVAIIGCGGIGKFHSKVYSMLPDAEVIAVADIRQEHAEKAASPHGARVYASMDSLLSNEKPDVIDICTPSYLHHTMVLQTLQLGHHVLCEKPLALQRDHAAAVVEAAQQSKGIFMVAQVVRFWDEYATIKKYLSEETYGKLQQAWFSRTGSAPLWSWENWFLDEARSGLAPFDLHIHDTDFIHYLLGTPESVRSVGIADPSRPETSYLRSEYMYPNLGPIGAEGGWFPARIPFRATFRVIFEGAALDYRSDGQLMCYPADSDPFPVPLEAEIKTQSDINIDTVRPYYNEIRYFLDCINTGKEPSVVTPQDSAASLEMLLAEIQSARTGKTIKLG